VSQYSSVWKPSDLFREELALAKEAMSNLGKVYVRRGMQLFHKLNYLVPTQ
jgi:hypothetical protein